MRPYCHASIHPPTISVERLAACPTNKNNTVNNMKPKTETIRSYLVRARRETKDVPVKHEYLMYEPRLVMGPWKVLICEDDCIVAARHFWELEKLFEDAAQYWVKHPTSRVAIEMRSGRVQELR